MALSGCKLLWNVGIYDRRFKEPKDQRVDAGDDKGPAPRQTESERLPPVLRESEGSVATIPNHSGKTIPMVLLADEKTKSRQKLEEHTDLQKSSDPMGSSVPDRPVR